MTDPDTTTEPEPLTDEERELVRGVLADYYTDPLEGGEAEAHTGASHGVSPPSSGPTDPHPEGPLT